MGKSLGVDLSIYCTFYLVRHGQTEWNLNKILQGHGDSALTSKGVDQAGQLAKEFKDKEFAAIFSSDLLRAKRTADIIRLERRLAIQTTQLLRERSYGQLDGKPRDAIKSYEAIFEKLSEQEKPHFKYEQDTESDHEVAQKALRFIRETAVVYPGRSVLCVTHGGLMRALLILLGFGTYKTLGFGSVGNTAWIKLVSDGVDFFVEKTQGIVLS